MDVLAENEGMLAVHIARHAIESKLKGDTYAPTELPPIFNEKRGVFVTLKKLRDLRGCIGIPYPIMPLKIALIEAAISAAVSDPRFPPVRNKELPDIAIEVTILSVPKLLTTSPEQRPTSVKVGTHGLIIQERDFSGLLLPQVPLEYGWDSTTFLEHTCLKAGLHRDCWKMSSVDVFTFEGQIFNE